MSLQKPTDLTKLRDHYGLALEEIKLRRSINCMSAVVESIGDPHQHRQLQSRINQHKRQLDSLRKLRGDLR
jgi:hypothetical protein